VVSTVVRQAGDGSRIEGSREVVMERWAILGMDRRRRTPRARLEGEAEADGKEKPRHPRRDRQGAIIGPVSKQPRGA
jgi:hypothetical protein